MAVVLCGGGPLFLRLGKDIPPYACHFSPLNGCFIATLAQLQKEVSLFCSDTMLSEHSCCCVRWAWRHSYWVVAAAKFFVDLETVLSSLYLFSPFRQKFIQGFINLIITIPVFKTFPRITGWQPTDFRNANILSMEFSSGQTLSDLPLLFTACLWS